MSDSISEISAKLPNGRLEKAITDGPTGVLQMDIEKLHQIAKEGDLALTEGGTEINKRIALKLKEMLKRVVSQYMKGAQLHDVGNKWWVINGGGKGIGVMVDASNAAVGLKVREREYAPEELARLAAAARDHMPYHSAFEGRRAISLEGKPLHAFPMAFELAELSDGDIERIDPSHKVHGLIETRDTFKMEKPEGVRKFTFTQAGVLEGKASPLNRG